MSKRRVSTVDWFIGDRVTREIYMDDGTWAREGDACLPGPLKCGVITAKEWNHEMRRYEFRVRWDDGSMSCVLAHGIDREAAEAHARKGDR